MKKYTIYDGEEVIAITSIEALAEDFCNKNGYKYTEEETDKRVPTWKRLTQKSLKKQLIKAISTLYSEQL